MRIVRPALAIAAATVLLVGLNAHAAAKPVSWTDQAGDANGTDWLLLDSGLPAPLDKGIPGPGSSAARDVIKTELANTFVKQGKKTVCTGFTITETFSGPPTIADTIYRLTTHSDANPGIFLFEHDTSNGGQDDIRHGRAAQTDEETIPTQKPVKVVGNKLIWTLTTKDISNMGEKTGSVLDKLGAEISGSVKGAILLPVYELSTAPADTTFTICK
jgi:hypothetical protein